MDCKSKQRSGALHVTQKVDYGIILLTALANKEKGTHSSIQKLSKENNLSFSFLQKVAGLLQKANLIVAERGKHGGYTLLKSPRILTIKEIIEAVEGPIALVPCLSSAGKNSCKSAPSCQVRTGFKKINDEIQRAILSKNLASFL